MVELSTMQNPVQVLKLSTSTELTDPCQGPDRATLAQTSCSGKRKRKWGGIQLLAYISVPSTSSVNCSKSNSGDLAPLPIFPGN